VELRAGVIRQAPLASGRSRARLYGFQVRPQRGSASSIVFVFASGNPIRVSGYGLHDRAIKVLSPAEAKRILPLASVSIPALGLTQARVQWAPGWPGRDADHSPPSTAEV
jgi:hypothetical protein